MTEHLLIDGFNFAYGKTRQNTGGSSTHQNSQDGPADIKQMVYELESYCLLRDKAVTVVFDGTRFEGEFASSKGVRVLCTPPKESADEMLRRLMNVVQPRERLLWVLVTDDGALRSSAIAMGLRVRRPQELALEIDASRKEQGRQDDLKPRKPFNSPFENL